MFSTGDHGNQEDLLSSPIILRTAPEVKVFKVSDINLKSSYENKGDIKIEFKALSSSFMALPDVSSSGGTGSDHGTFSRRIPQSSCGLVDLEESNLWTSKTLVTGFNGKIIAAEKYILLNEYKNFKVIKCLYFHLFL